jgi:hypothetical protein
MSFELLKFENLIDEFKRIFDTNLCKYRKSNNIEESMHIFCHIYGIMYQFLMTVAALDTTTSNWNITDVAYSIIKDSSRNNTTQLISKVWNWYYSDNYNKLQMPLLSTNNSQNVCQYYNFVQPYCFETFSNYLINLKICYLYTTARNNILKETENIVQVIINNESTVLYYKI